jgi:hypothetical protein
MSSERQISKGKKINPHFWVFCEGKTEEAYISFLRYEYRLPAEIVTKIAGCNISKRYIESYKKGKPILKKDMTVIQEISTADCKKLTIKINDVPSYNY